MKAPPLSKFTKAEIPTRAGRLISSKHVLGENPRRAKFTAAPGTNPRLFEHAGRTPGGMSHATAPNKDHPGLFSTNIGFGGPGSTEPV